MMNRFLRVICCVSALLPAALSAQWWESSFDFDLGYREDSLTCLINAYDPPENFLFSDDLTIDDLRVYEIGAKGKCIACESLLFKGFLYMGRIERGNYKEVDDGVKGLQKTTKLKVVNGQTVDFSVGAGYLFPCFYCVRIGPTAGYSYNHQHVKMECAGKPLCGLKYKNRWQGAWVGVDGYFSFCGFGVNAGYEYHIPNWSGYWLIKKNVQGGPYSDVRKATRGWGNVVYFDAYTVSFLCIKLNCQLKYQYWKMQDGCEHPKSTKFSSLGLGNNRVDKIPHATWQSFEVLFGLGLDF